MAEKRARWFAAGASRTWNGWKSISEVNRLERVYNPELIVIEKEEEYMVPDNCWAIELLPDGSKVLLTEKVVKGNRNIVLLSRIKGG